MAGAAVGCRTERFSHVLRLLNRSGPFADAAFDTSFPALLGFGNIHVIDMDTIDLSNLNRQFLFRPQDIGRDKAGVAAAFVNERVPDTTVTPHFNKIQDFGPSFYAQFAIVVCGLDSIPARRWLNNMLLSLLEYDDKGDVKQESIKPLIDGGTEGFKGNARVILPGKTACVECSLDLYPPQVTFPMCTIAERPRLPEHCIEYAKVIVWPREHGDDTPLDGDDPEHIKWLYDRALERAEHFGIRGVTYRLTQGVVKNIIPAVASTNAVIAAACATETLKVATSCCGAMNNYMVFNDTEGVYSYTFEYERKPYCLACGPPKPVPCSADTALMHFIEILTSDPDFRLKEPVENPKTGERDIFQGLSANINGKTKTLYMGNPPSLKRATEKNLLKTLAELGIVSGGIINVTDPMSPRPFKLIPVFEQ